MPFFGFETREKNSPNFVLICLAVMLSRIRRNYLLDNPKNASSTYFQGRMARGGHGLLKVSQGPAMPYPSIPCGRANPETSLLLWTPHAARLCI
jgi:hypothetical protein